MARYPNITTPDDVMWLRQQSGDANAHVRAALEAARLARIRSRTLWPAQLALCA